MRTGKLQFALKTLSQAIRDVDAILGEMRAEHDPPALHIFIARRRYRNLDDHSKHGHHKEREARSSYREACELGFRGNQGEWRRLTSAVLHCFVHS
jgi:hypothetical protein